MKQTPYNLMQFRNSLDLRKPARNIYFACVGRRDFAVPAEHGEVYFHRTRHLYHCKACGYQASLTAGTVFHKTRTPLHKWFWMIWLMGRQKSGISMLSLQGRGNQNLQNCLDHGPQDSPSPGGTGCQL